MKKNKKGINAVIAFIGLAGVVALVIIFIRTPDAEPQPEVQEEPGEHQGVVEYHPDTKPIEVKVKDAYPIETGIIVQSEDEMLIELSYEVNDLSPEDAPEPGSTISILPTEDEQYYRLVE